MPAGEQADRQLREMAGCFELRQEMFEEAMGGRRLGSNMLIRSRG